MNVIEFNNVSKKFKKGEKFNSLRDAIPRLFKSFVKKSGKSELEAREFWALKDVSFAVKKGEVLGIIGPNGAGKSTILKLLSRIMNPTKGEVKIQGRLSALIEVTAGFHNELTGRENVYLNGTIIGMTKKEIDEQFDEIVEFSGLSEFIDTPVKRYSSGMYSRLGFSVAAHMNPDILLVDEVLSVGDIAFQAKCVRKMQQLLHSGCTIVLVSHNLSLVEGMAERVIFLNKGRIISEGGPKEIISFYKEFTQNMQAQELQEHDKTSYKVRSREKEKIEIADSFLSDTPGRGTESGTLEKLKIKVFYNAREKIHNPVFRVEVIRVDGVVCCSFNNRSGDFKIDSIEGKGELNIEADNIHLNAGTYLLQTTVWDEDMVILYTDKRSGVFTVKENGLSAYVDTIFLPPARWILEKKN